MGNVAYVIPVRIVARQPTIVEDVRIDSPWDDYTINFPCLVERRGRYQFGTSSYLPREVLNDHFDRAFQMSRGAMLEGVILAYGCEQIPDELRGGVVSVQFTVIDALGREARGEILLSVQRSVKTDSAAAGARTWPSVPAKGSAEKHVL